MPPIMFEALIFLKVNRDFLDLLMVANSMKNKSPQGTESDFDWYGTPSTKNNLCNSLFSLKFTNNYYFFKNICVIIYFYVSCIPITYFHFVQQKIC